MAQPGQDVPAARVGEALDQGQRVAEPAARAEVRVEPQQPALVGGGDVELGEGGGGRGGGGGGGRGGGGGFGAAGRRRRRRGGGIAAAAAASPPDPFPRGRREARSPGIVPLLLPLLLSPAAPPSLPLSPPGPSVFLRRARRGVALGDASSAPSASAPAGVVPAPAAPP